MLTNRVFVGIIALAPAPMAMADTFTMVALGDSISAGVNSRGVGDNREYSWATGWEDGIPSHRARIYDLLSPGDRLLSVNLARSGHTVADLERDQLSEAIAQQPDYVTLMIGANDVCTWPDQHGGALADFTRTLRSSVERLTHEVPEVRITMVPIPDMLWLYELGRQNGCQIVWDFTSFCKPLLHSSRSATDRQAFGERLRDANDAIHQIALEYSESVFEASEVAHHRFESRDISNIDCFHPSVRGQHKLAAFTWNRDWAFP